MAIYRNKRVEKRQITNFILIRVSKSWASGNHDSKIILIKREKNILSINKSMNEQYND